MNKYEFPLLLAVFLDLVGFGMVFPDFQLRAEGFGAPGWLIGAVLSSYYFVQMGASPRWGRLSDLVGRKPILIICTVLSAASMLVYAFATDMYWLLAARTLAGLGAANVVTAQAYITDSVAGKARIAALGRIGAAVTAGLLLGPVIGGFLAELGGNLAVGLTAACASTVGAVWLIIGVPSRKPVAEATSEHRQSLVPLLRGRPQLTRLFIVAATGWFAIACLEGTFGRLIHAKFDYHQIEFGIILGLEAAVAVLVQGFLLPAMLRRSSEYALLRASYVLQGIGLAMMPFMPGMGMLLFAASIHGTGVGGSNPVINGLASDLTPSTRQGELFGMLQASRSIGFLIGPIIGGLLFDWRPMAPYVAAAVILLCVILVAPRNPHKVVASSG